MSECDRPYGNAEKTVDGGQFERGSEKYQRKVARMKTVWQLRRDFAHQNRCCLEDGHVQFGVFS